MVEFKSPLEEALFLAHSSMSYADMLLECSDGVVPVHRSILAASSPLLRPILLSYNAIESNRVLLPDISTAVIKHLLSILYIGKTTSDDKEILKEVVAAGKLLGMDEKLFENGSNSWEIECIKIIKPPPEPVHEKTTPLSILDQPHKLFCSNNSINLNCNQKRNFEQVEKKGCAVNIKRPLIIKSSQTPNVNVIKELIESGQLTLGNYRNKNIPKVPPQGERRKVNIYKNRTYNKMSTTAQKNNKSLIPCNVVPPSPNKTLHVPQIAPTVQNTIFSNGIFTNSAQIETNFKRCKNISGVGLENSDDEEIVNLNDLINHESNSKVFSGLNEKDNNEKKRLILENSSNDEEMTEMRELGSLSNATNDAASDDAESYTFSLVS